MTWLGLIKEKLGEEKAKGNAPSINDIMPLAKKEWAEIKAGKHPKYEQGKAQTFARKNKGEKKTKKNKGSMSMSSPKSIGSPKNTDILAILNEAKICTKCKKKVEKMLKKKGMNGGTCGGTCAAGMSGGSCGGSCCGPM